MGKGNGLYGAAALTHALKEYGYGKSMQEGLKRIVMESRQDGFQRGLNYALLGIQTVGRLLGRTLNRG